MCRISGYWLVNRLTIDRNKNTVITFLSLSPSLFFLLTLLWLDDDNDQAQIINLFKKSAYELSKYSLKN